MRKNAVLTLANTRGIDLLNPCTADYMDWSWVAEHCAKENRFNGATPGVCYSVAEHMTRGARAILDNAVAKTGDSAGGHELAGYFLCHDVHEAVLKDDTTPKKQALAHIARQFGVMSNSVMQSFKSLEYRHDVAIHAAAGLQWPPSSEMQKAIKRWDLVMFVTEWRDLMGGIPHPEPEPYALIEPLPEVIKPAADWRSACDRYLALCRDLLPGLKARVPA